MNFSNKHNKIQWHFNWIVSIGFQLSKHQFFHKTLIYVLNTFISRCEIIEDIINTPVCVNVTDTETEEVCKLVDAEYTPPTPTLPPQTCFKKECKRIDTTTLVKECKPITYQECDVQITEEVQFVKYSHAKSKKCIFKGYYGHGVRPMQK